MSNKWLEYIKLIPEGIKNAPSVVEGIVNTVKMDYGSLDEDKKEEIIRRRVICEGCPFNSMNAQVSPEYKEVTGRHYTSDREDFHCSFCGCPIQTRTATLGKPCGINTWNKNHKDKQLALKWDVYGKSN